MNSWVKEAPTAIGPERNRSMPDESVPACWLGPSFAPCIHPPTTVFAGLGENLKSVAVTARGATVHDRTEAVPVPEPSDPCTDNVWAPIPNPELWNGLAQGALGAPSRLHVAETPLAAANVNVSTDDGVGCKGLDSMWTDGC